MPPLPPPAGRTENCAPAALDVALAAAGIAAPRSALAANADEAAHAAAEIGFPVALKIVSPQAGHKTEVGGVALDLRDASAVRAAADAMAARLRAVSPDAVIDGFLVQEMVSGTEVLVGAREDALYGPLLVLGTGGVMVELIGDVALRLLPVTGDDVRAMIGGLKLRTLLAGFRGAPPGDTDALVAACLALGQFYLDHRPWLADIEINPLMVRPRGQGVCAVDVRTVRRNT